MPTIELTEEQSRLLDGAADATVVDAGGRAYRLTPAGGDGPESAASDRGPRPSVPADFVAEAAERMENSDGPFFTTGEVLAHLQTLRREGAA